MDSQTNKSVFYLSKYLKSFTCGPNPVIGHYVYEFRSGFRPFYVGMGTNRRAWNQHYPSPEKMRQTCRNFRVYILHHNLTKAEAHLLERYHIDTLLKRGIVLLNERIPRI